jgi:hypothetical protein
MTEREIMEQIKKLTTAERLTVVEKTLRSIREELEQIEKPVSDTDLKRLAKAAEALLADYASRGDLTAFTALWQLRLWTEEKGSETLPRHFQIPRWFQVSGVDNSKVNEMCWPGRW